MFTTQAALQQVVQPLSHEDGIERTVLTPKTLTSKEEIRDMAAAAASAAISALKMTSDGAAEESGGPFNSCEGPAADNEPTNNEKRTRDADVLLNANKNRTTFRNESKRSRQRTTQERIAAGSPISTKSGIRFWRGKPVIPARGYIQLLNQLSKDRSW